MAGFDSWIDTFVEEKGLNLEHRFEVEGPDWGWNSIPLSEVVAFTKHCGPENQSQIKSKLVEIDYGNGDAMHFFEYLAKGMAR